MRLEVRLEGETLWLTLTQMAGLFERDPSVIGKHLRSVYASGELSRKTTAARNAVVRLEGNRQVTRQVEVFNLDAILSVGYRVNSKRELPLSRAGGVYGSGTAGIRAGQAGRSGACSRRVGTRRWSTSSTVMGTMAM